MNEGVYVEIFHDGHGRQLFLILIFLDRVFFGVRPWRTCLIHRLGTISRLDLSGIRGSSFREQLAILARRAQFSAPRTSALNGTKKKSSPVFSPRVAPSSLSLSVWSVFPLSAFVFSCENLSGIL